MGSRSSCIVSHVSRKQRVGGEGAEEFNYNSHVCKSLEVVGYFLLYLNGFFASSASPTRERDGCTPRRATVVIFVWGGPSAGYDNGNPDSTA